MKKERALSTYTGILGDKKHASSPFFADLTMATVAKTFPDFTTPERLLWAHVEASGRRSLNTTVIPEHVGKEVFSSSSFKRPHFNTCVHLRDRFVSLPYTSFVQKSANNLYCGIGYNRDSLNPRDPGIGSYYSRWAPWQQARLRAWYSMQPRFEGEISMLNFLFELKDFRDLAKLALRPKDTVKRLKSFQQKMRSIDRRLCRNSSPISCVREIVDTGASAIKVSAQLRLINEFALKPLISDMLAILKQAQQIVDDVQSQFKRDGMDEQTQHYSEVEVETDTLPSADSPVLYWTVPYGYGVRRWITFTATLKYMYQYNLRDASEAFRKYWGLNVTSEAVWNAIPFSFLLDYFAKIGRMQHDMATDPNVVLTTTQYCESLLTRYSSGYCATGNPRIKLVVDGKLATRGTVICGREGTYYERRLTSPLTNGLVTPRLNLPNGRQGLNMAALAVCFLK